MVKFSDNDIIMNYSSFFLSYPGMYLAQSVFHSLISVIIVERAIQVWQIKDPRIKQRFRFIVIILPIFSFPVYQLLNRDRGSVLFRMMEALFDLNRWLDLELWGMIPLHVFFFMLLFISTLFFIFQEFVPVIKHTFESGKTTVVSGHRVTDSKAHCALESLPGQNPELIVIDEHQYVLFSRTGKDPTIVISTGLIGTLSPDQLKAALAHELAHVVRSKGPALLIVFLMRMLMFFNPVILIEFRKIVQEEEKICDDFAVGITEKPHVLAEALRRLYHRTGDLNPFRMEKLTKIRSSLEEYSHNLHIESRIKRLEQGRSDPVEGAQFKYLLTLTVVMVLNYFIV